MQQCESYGLWNERGQNAKLGSVAGGYTPKWNSGSVGIHCQLLLQSNCMQRQLPSCPESSLASYPMPYSSADLYPRSQAATEDSCTACQYLRGAQPSPHGLTLLLSEEPRPSPAENGVHTKSHRRGCHPRSPICPKFLCFISPMAPFHCKTKLQTGWGASTGVGS